MGKRWIMSGVPPSSFSSYGPSRRAGCFSFLPLQEASGLGHSEASFHHSAQPETDKQNTSKNADSTFDQPLKLFSNIMCSVYFMKVSNFYLKSFVLPLALEAFSHVALRSRLTRALHPKASFWLSYGGSPFYWLIFKILTLALEWREMRAIFAFNQGEC